jgi:hypothetical protein
MPNGRIETSWAREADVYKFMAVSDEAPSEISVDKRIRPLDALKESVAGSAVAKAPTSASTDMTLMTRELDRILHDVVDALGGGAVEEPLVLAAKGCCSLPGL